MSTPAHADGAHGAPDSDERRDFLIYATGAVAAAGVAFAAVPFVSSMNPAADVLALASTEVDLAGVAEGQSITVTWRGKPVFIRHRTQAEIEAARSTPMDDLVDPQPDAERVQKPEWLIMVGICTHLGCVPLGQKPADPKGEFGGWFCPCHGSHYDQSGRIRKGPAPANLEVPVYEFLDEAVVRIG